MFVLGYNVYGDESSHFSTINCVNDLRRIELSNCTIDEINIDNTIEIEYETSKYTWTFTTRLLASFQNNLEAGNINISGLPVEYIKLCRRVKGELEWQDYITWKFDVNTRYYSFFDKYVINKEIYEYATVPIAVGGIEGVYNYGEIKCQYTGYYLMDKTRTYKLMFDVMLESVAERMVSSIDIPMGSKYPIVSFNGNTDFAEGSLSGLSYLEDLCSTQSLNPLEHIKEAREFRKNFIAFAKNGLPKILKDKAGNMWLCAIHGDIDVRFKNETSNVLADISFP